MSGGVCESPSPLSACSGHGSCVLAGGEYACVCDSGWSGIGDLLPAATRPNCYYHQPTLRVMWAVELLLLACQIAFAGIRMYRSWKSTPPAPGSLLSASAAAQRSCCGRVYDWFARLFHVLRSESLLSTVCTFVVGLIGIPIAVWRVDDPQQSIMGRDWDATILSAIYSLIVFAGFYFFIHAFLVLQLSLLRVVPTDRELLDARIRRLRMGFIVSFCVLTCFSAWCFLAARVVPAEDAEWWACVLFVSNGVQCLVMGLTFAKTSSDVQRILLPPVVVPTLPPPPSGTTNGASPKAGFAAVSVVPSAGSTTSPALPPNRIITIAPAPAPATAPVSIALSPKAGAHPTPAPSVVGSSAPASRVHRPGTPPASSHTGNGGARIHSTAPAAVASPKAKSDPLSERLALIDKLRYIRPFVLRAGVLMFVTGVLFGFVPILRFSAPYYIVFTAISSSAVQIHALKIITGIDRSMDAGAAPVVPAGESLEPSTL